MYVSDCGFASNRFLNAPVTVLLLTRQSYVTLSQYVPASDVLKIQFLKVIYRLQKPKIFSKINEKI